MNIFDWVGWIGLAMLMVAWIPQTWDTIRAGRTHMNAIFLLLYTVSSLLLLVHSIIIKDLIFSILNAVLMVGGAINLYYKWKPKPPKSSF